MANGNTKVKRAAGHQGYGVKRGHPVDSGKLRARKGKHPYVGGTPSKGVVALARAQHRINRELLAKGQL